MRNALLIAAAVALLPPARAQEAAREPAQEPAHEPAQEEAPREDHQAPGPIPPPAPGIEEPPPLLDLEQIDTSEVRAFQFHGRVDLTFALLEGENQVDDFRETDLVPLSPGILLSYRFLRIFEADLEVEWEGLEEEIDVDRAVLEVDPFEERLVLKVGRDILPFGVERFFYAPSTNVLIDRPAAFRAVFPGTFSDYGVFAGGRFRHADGWGVSYESAVSFGLQDHYDEEGLPEPPEDHNRSPQFAGRLGFSPAQDLGVGVSYLVGEYDRDELLQVDFVGFDVRYELHGTRLRAEWVGGGVERLREDGGDLSRHGWYVQVDRRWELPWKRPRALETAIRYDDIDPDNTARDSLDLRRWAFGLNLEIIKNLRWKNEYEIVDERHDDHANNGFYSQIEFHW